MPVAMRQIHPVFAAEVTGIDCTQPLSPDDVAVIEAGMDEYAVLVFRDQALTDQQQIGFTRHFGELEGYNTPGHIRKREDSRLEPGIADFSNLDKSGKIMSEQDRVWFFKLDDRLWHPDSSFRPVPAKYSLLSGCVIPSWIEPLVCEHSLMFPREAIGFTDLTPEERAAFRPVRQRLVRTHPVTGRKSLFLSSHAGTILGWTVPEARMFLRDLTEFATKDRFVYSLE